MPITPTAKKSSDDLIISSESENEDISQYSQDISDKEQDENG